MNQPEPVSDQEWNKTARNETPLQRLDRNWGDLLQELRVTQTGVQLLTGFLLTLPFQARFEDLDRLQQHIYLGTVAASIVATGLLIAPVAVHRLLFREHLRRKLVAVAHRLAITGLGFLGLAIIGAVLLIFDVVAGRAVGIAAAAIAAILVAGLWITLPLGLLHGSGRSQTPVDLDGEPTEDTW